MIKRQNRKYVLCFGMCLFLEVALLLAAYAINFYTKTRLGMLRHMVYLNGKWEEKYPVEMLKYVLVVLLSLLLIGLILGLTKNHSRDMLVFLSGVVSVIISACTICFLLLNSTDTYKSYYALSICFVLITMIQGCNSVCLIKLISK